MKNGDDIIHDSEELLPEQDSFAEAKEIEILPDEEDISPTHPIEEGEWMDSEAIAWAQAFEANPNDPDVKNLLDSPAFIRTQRGSLGYTVQEYLAHRGEGESKFAEKITYGNHKNAPDNFLPLPMSDRVVSYEGVLPPGYLRWVLEENGGEFPITFDVLRSLHNNMGLSLTVRLLTRETAVTDGEKSLISQLEKAAKKLGIPVIPPVFIGADSATHPIANASFNRSDNHCFLLFTEQFVNHELYSPPERQEGTSLHEFAHGMVNKDIYPASWALAHHLTMASRALFNGAAALGAGSAASVVLDKVNPHPYYPVLSSVSAAIAVVAGALGVLTSTMAGLFAAKAIKEGQFEEFYADGIAALHVDNPHRYLELKKQANAFEFETRREASGGNAFENIMRPATRSMADQAMVFFARAMGLKTLRSHPPDSDREKFAERVVQLRLAQEKKQNEL